VIFIVVILSPYTFFAGLDCLISGRIWKDDKPSLPTAINILAGVAFIVAGMVSVGYYSYYQQVYLPSIADEEQLNNSINSLMPSSATGEKSSKKSLSSHIPNPDAETDPFWKMVARDKQERRWSMQRAPWICAGLWAIVLFLYLAYFISLIPHAK
jgi:hypothetical protein